MPTIITRGTADGPIASLADREAYVDLGRLNRTPGAPDDETITWACEATLARVADGATDEDWQRILGWVRQGEAAR